MTSAIPVEQLIIATYVTQRFQNAATALVAYDYLLTLAQEVHLVWYGRWSVPSVIFMINRYGVLAYALFSGILLDVGLGRIADVGLSQIPSLEGDQGFLTTFFCEYWSTMGSWSIPVITLLIEAMLVMRVLVICGKGRAITFFLWGLYAFCAVASIALIVLEVLNTRSMSRLLKLLRHLATWQVVQVMESTLVLLTGIRSFQYNWTGVDTPLLTLLTRDGFMYFFSVFLLMLANLIICLTPHFILYSILVDPALSVSSVLANRLFLNLRYTADEARRRNSTSVASGPRSLDSFEDAWED